jgi:hypothetical protein
MMSPRADRNAPILKLLSRLLCAGIVAFLFPLMSHGQISPGPLAKAHQSFNGPQNCTQCHTVSTRSASFRCSECHREIAAEVEGHHGLHSTYPLPGPPGAACVKCHSDHNGENFNMLHWDPTMKGFDHSKTGYVLDGKHATTACRDCHTAKNIAPAARALLSKKELNHTWMGLSPTCTTCHEDKHQGRFGPNCLQCHNTTTWKGAKFDEQTFDHSKTRYPLTGKHMTTPCAKCHTPGDDGQPRYAGLKFQFCVDCHADPHKGEFKQTCETCHTTASWTRSSFTSKFDHSKTDYPLVGKHREVACVDCHKSGDFKTKIAFKACTDCHKDEHGGQFAQRADKGRCESCHTVQGWSPSTFTAADHAKTKYPLVPPHANLKCADCHKPAGPGGKDTKYKMKFAACLDCHKDEHQGQFAADPWRNRCEQCHNGNKWKVSNYNIEVHKKSNFPLDGGHIAVACNDCHKPASPNTVVLYHFPQLSCTSCHEDIHHGEFKERMQTRNKAGKPAGCESCHSTKDWHDMDGFDHSATKFPLIGSHRAVDCADCHKPPNMERTLLHVDFSKAPQACSECHEDPHGHQFADREGDCASCHNSNKWKPSLFDHEKTKFSLKGGHQNVACKDCHSLMKEVNGKQVLFYKPTPLACADCHGTNIPKQTDKSSLEPWPLAPGASTNSRFDGAESYVKMHKRLLETPLPKSDHVSLKLHRTSTYLRCLDLSNCRPCESPGPQRTTKVSEGMSAPGASEYLRQSGKVKSQPGTASVFVDSQRIG